MSKIIKLPGLVDPHVHFRTPGLEYKEDFTTGSTSAYYGGFSYVLDMPNTNPATVTEKDLDEKIIATRNISIKIGFQFGATLDNLEEIKKVEDKISAIKVFFGSSTGNLLVNDEEVLEKIMRETTKIITVHAEDEDTIQKNNEKFTSQNDPKVHSMIRNPEAARVAVEKIIRLVRKTNHPVYFCHVSTKGELDLIREAKKEGLPVFAEATPHHLYFDDSMYEQKGNLIKVNPPIRSREDVEALWKAVNDGTIDTIGSDHAPHLLSEKMKDYREAPSGMPGVETSLPLMLNAVNEGRLTIDRLVKLMSTNSAEIFGLDLSGMETKVDLDEKKVVTASELHSKCGWSPYEGMELQGWPVVE